MYKVALIYDAPAWAFHRIALQVATHSTNEFEFTLIPSGNPRSWRTFHTNISGEFDWYHYLWRGAIDSISKSGVHNLSTAVYDHQFLDTRRYTTRLLESVPFYVASQKLAHEYARIFPERKSAICSDGVDTNFFRPVSVPGGQPTLRIGWVGNSSWGHNSNKGFHEIFNKAIEKGRGLGLNIEAHVADASVVARSHADMFDFYQEIDVLCCTSLSEGTPNPILEAASSGRAWISTDVGIVPELAGRLQQEFIVSRSVDSFVSAFSRLSDDRQLIKELGSENRQIAQEKWQWRDRAQNIVGFLRSAINEKNQ